MLYSIFWHARCGIFSEHAPQKVRKLNKNNKKLTNLTKGKINPYQKTY